MLLKKKTEKKSKNKRKKEILKKIRKKKKNCRYVVFLLYEAKSSKFIGPFICDVHHSSVFAHWACTVVDV